MDDPFPSCFNFSLKPEPYLCRPIAELPARGWLRGWRQLGCLFPLAFVSLPCGSQIRASAPSNCRISGKDEAASRELLMSGCSWKGAGEGTLGDGAGTAGREPGQAEPEAVSA